MTILRTLFFVHTGAELEIAFTMSDEDAALRNALATNFPNAVQLSCYFHLLKLIRTHFKNSPGYVEAITFLRDCHHTFDDEHYLNTYNEFMRKIITKLVKYDNDEYLSYKRVIDYVIQKCDYTSPARNFQMFLTPPGTYTVNLGYAATNNPLETHNIR